MAHEFTGDSYIYFARDLEYEKKEIPWYKNLTAYKKHLMEINPEYYTEERANWFIHCTSDIKIGESTNLESRYKALRYAKTCSVTIKKYVYFKGTKDERLFIESYLRSKYAKNNNMENAGNDYFYCANINTIKGAENQFFKYVTEAFEILSVIKGKQYNFECKNY